MGLFDRFLDALRPGSRVRVGTGLEVSRWNAAPPRKGEWELIQAYKLMPWLFAMVSKTSSGVAGVCWTAHKRVDGRTDYGIKNAAPLARRTRIKALTDAGEMQEVPDAPILRLLADPNDHLTGRACTKLFQTHLDLVGESFLVLDRDPVTKIPVGFWPTPPHWVRQLPDMRLPLADRYYTVQVAGSVRYLPAGDVVHLRDVDPDDPLGRGVGVGYSLGDELDTTEYVSRFIKLSFFNNALPAAVVGIEGMTNSNDNVKRWQEKLNSEYQGIENVGKILTVGGKVSVSTLGSPFKDLQLVELWKHLLNFQRWIYGIPPEIMGDVSASNRATANAAEAIFASQVISPRMEFLRTEFQKRLVPLLGDDVILDYESPVPADRDFELRASAAMPSTVSKNEWREKQGLKPLKQFDGQFPSEAPGSKPDNGGNSEPPSPDPSSPEADAKRKALLGLSPEPPLDPEWVKDLRNSRLNL